MWIAGLQCRTQVQYSIPFLHMGNSESAVAGKPSSPKASSADSSVTVVTRSSHGRVKRAAVVDAGAPQSSSAGTLKGWLRER